MLYHFLIWDLGATKCSAALTQCGPQGKVRILDRCYHKLSELTSLDSLIEAIFSDLKIETVDAIFIGAAGQYDGHTLKHEHDYPFKMDFAAAAKRHNWPTFTITHDYVPIVCATFTDYLHNPENIHWIHKRDIQTHGRRVAVGIGTGLGMKDGVLLENDDFWLGSNEAGHIGVIRPPMLEGCDLERHRDFLDYLRKVEKLSIQSPLTFESILSGTGTVRMHEFVYGCNNALSPEALGVKMREGQADETLAIFAWYLGLFIGTMQLVLMPTGGIWLTGGVLLKHIEVINNEELMKGIWASPAYPQLRENYPIALLKNQDHAFYGGSFYALKKLMRDA